MKKLIFTILLAAVLWTVMFSPWTAPFVNFWWMMTGSALTLSVFATLFNPGWWREVKWSLPNVLLGIGMQNGHGRTAIIQSFKECFFICYLSFICAQKYEISSLF
jgi:hypothetical protein